MGNFYFIAKSKIENAERFVTILFYHRFRKLARNFTYRRFLVNHVMPLAHQSIPSARECRADALACEAPKRRTVFNYAICL